METTILRTGAATGVAAKYLARAEATTATICGCGNQGRVSQQLAWLTPKLCGVNIDKPIFLATQGGHFQA